MRLREGREKRGIQNTNLPELDSRKRSHDKKRTRNFHFEDKMIEKGDNLK
jgi:hypothetical protein